MTSPLITNEQEYEAIIEAIELLLGAESGTAEATELEVLVKLIDDYNDIHYPING